MAKRNRTTASKPAQPTFAVDAVTSKVPFAPRSTPTIPAAPPSQLLRLRDDKLPDLEFDNWDLDEILKDNVTEHCLHRCDPDGCYMIGFLPHFGWWLQVSEALADCLDCNVGEPKITREHQEFKRKLQELETVVLSRFPAAHLAEPTFLEYSSAPKLELLKAYRSLTLFLGETAKAFWPNENLHWLIYHA